MGSENEKGTLSHESILRSSGHSWLGRESQEGSRCLWGKKERQDPKGNSRTDRPAVLVPVTASVAAGCQVFVEEASIRGMKFSF